MAIRAGVAMVHVSRMVQWHGGRQSEDAAVERIWLCTGTGVFRGIY